ncbi:penicillin-binding protein activator LpoB [Cupriavidus pauculus]|uniref:Penicillin-binding protein activator LpoB n=1 Tax=Cupriavidus pauculus TaxID=82633 RepID=A0A2N5CAT3_9BURK|nr:penicillin-binding protein activator LpoB [Cupriavidus pauculus]PLP99284.1 penicillin-binding protein activator LpoB [Cupriavidus pauculus]
MNKTNTRMGRLMAWGAAIGAALWLAGCAVTDVGRAPQMAAGDTVAVLPIVNYTETPQAGLRAEAIAEALLKTGGVANLKRYPAALNPETLFEPAERESVNKALDWARSERARYALTGAVQEWRYKVGVDGEPAVGISLQLIEVSTGQVVWSATGSNAGWSRESLSGVAQKLLRRLLAPLMQG